MALTIDTISNKLIMEIQTGDTVERFDCDISACPNPVCACGTVYLNLTNFQNSDQNQDFIDSYALKIDIYERSQGYSDADEVSDDVLQFTETVLSHLDDDDYKILHEKHFTHKNKITEEASPDSIDFPFDYEEVEYNGLMYFYNDVLPYSERLVTTVDGTQYEIQDQYCLLPKCSCSDVTLSFMSVGGDGELIDESCDISLNYQKKRWEATENYQSDMDIRSVRSAVEQQIPDIYGILYARHSRLKSIYAHNKKRNYNPPVVTSSTRVGRNDPCPCGSGKKYKKCCLGK